MLNNLYAERAKPTNHALPGNSGLGNNKAAKLSAAIEQVFQGHQAKFGSKTLLSIAYSFAAA